MTPQDKEIQELRREVERLSVLLEKERWELAVLRSLREPKKVKLNHHCPTCGVGLSAKGITGEYGNCCFRQAFCPGCGQALDWGDEE